VDGDGLHRRDEQQIEVMKGDGAYDDLVAEHQCAGKGVAFAK
jgi:hypothetical protein